MPDDLQADGPRPADDDHLPHPPVDLLLDGRRRSGRLPPRPRQLSFQRYACRAGGWGPGRSADATVARVVEAVEAADPGERHVAGREPVRLAVELAVDLAVEEDVRLLERVVVAWAAPPARSRR
jgi:hypothetical protein